MSLIIKSIPIHQIIYWNRKGHLLTLRWRQHEMNHRLNYNTTTQINIKRTKIDFFQVSHSKLFSLHFLIHCLCNSNIYLGSWIMVLGFLYNHFIVFESWIRFCLVLFGFVLLVFVGGGRGWLTVPWRCGAVKWPG